MEIAQAGREEHLCLREIGNITVNEKLGNERRNTQFSGKETLKFSIFFADFPSLRKQFHLLFLQASPIVSDTVLKSRRQACYILRRKS
jgi:hypothetical protein